MSDRRIRYLRYKSVIMTEFPEDFPHQWAPSCNRANLVQPGTWPGSFFIPILVEPFQTPDSAVQRAEWLPEEDIESARD